MTDDLVKRLRANVEQEAMIYIHSWVDICRDFSTAADRIEAQEEEIKRLKAAVAREAMEAYKGNISAVNKLGLSTFDAQPILRAVQSWDISTGRARELLRCWVLGTFTPDMLPPCKGLDIGEDDDPAELLAEARREIENLRDMMGAALSGKEPPR